MLEAALKMMIEHCDEKLKAGAGVILSLSNRQSVEPEIGPISQRVYCPVKVIVNDANILIDLVELRLLCSHRTNLNLTANCP